MKKILYTISLMLVCVIACYSQEDEGGERIRDRMKEYIQKKLELSPDESSRFGPVFSNYSSDLRKTNQDFKGDRLVLQQKIAELRLHYRDEFKSIIGEKRSNDVFNYERDFINEVRKLRQERDKSDTSSNKRSGS